MQFRAPHERVLKSDILSGFCYARVSLDWLLKPTDPLTHAGDPSV